MQTAYMAGHTVILYDDTLGVTQKALTMFRDELVQRTSDAINIYLVPHTDGQGYGFIIVDTTRREVVIIGDGFRSDGQGEGDKGHKAVTAMLAIWGVSPIELLLPGTDSGFPLGIQGYESVVKKAVEAADGSLVLWRRAAHYISTKPPQVALSPAHRPMLHCMPGCTVHEHHIGDEL